MCLLLIVQETYLALAFQRIGCAQKYIYFKRNKLLHSILFLSREGQHQVFKI